MKLKIWGSRGSIPAPGPDTMRYGGNTSCVELTLSDGSTLILDAGTGIRDLGAAIPETDQPIHILLTHLHMDHIQGLMFFAPLFRPKAEIYIWGPTSAEASLRDRVARYISAPLAPVEVRELPSLVTFREADVLQWQVGPARILAQPVNHRGPTLGYRVEDAGTTIAYIPDHEPGLGAPLDSTSDEWISGFDLARGASLLIHDCQYTDEEYRHSYLGWGHCPIGDALLFAQRADVDRLLLFHHDPLHSDRFLDAMGHEVLARWHHMGGRAHRVELAAERRELEVLPHPALPAAGDPAGGPNGAIPSDHPVAVGSPAPRR
ncbi:MAG TPA: MBL fold metallo-hydrolase [Solirubrobacteraceae bacterium]|nr:MBL fold metallo-hydrolase [Solirubrobacteraceae bacterium]